MSISGDKVYINGKEYELGNRIGGGQEGAIYDVVGVPNYVIKIINTTKLTDNEKQSIMNHLYWLKNTIGANEDLKQKLTIPKALLDNEVGYIMVKAREHEGLKSYLSFPTDPEAFNEWYKKKYKLKKRLQIITSIFKDLELIHISGLLFTDLSPNNIMVHKNLNNILFIDTDNMRRKKDAYLSVLGTEGFMAPEIYRNYIKTNDKLVENGFNKEDLPKTGKLSIESDVFAAAIIAFELLTLQHPFVGDVVEEGTAEDEAKALRCETDYVLHESSSNESTTLPFVSFLDDCKIVTPQIKQLFYQTFVTGKDNPNLRPTATEFAEAFSDALDMVVQCPKCGEEYIYYSDKQNRCWDCNQECEKKVVLEIYDRYDELNRDILVDKILNIENNDYINEDNNSRFILLSNIVLEEENKRKFIYLRHFEWSVNRTKPIAVVTLLDKINGEIKLQLLDKNQIAGCCLINRKNTKEKVPFTDITKAKIFSFNQYSIQFEIRDSRVGTIKTLGCFRYE